MSFGYHRYYPSTSYYLEIIGHWCAQDLLFCTVLFSVATMHWALCIIQLLCGFQHAQSTIMISLCWVSPLGVYTPNNKCKTKYKTMKGVHLSMLSSIWPNLCGMINLEIMVSVPFYWIYQNHFLLTNLVFWFFLLPISDIHQLNTSESQIVHLIHFKRVVNCDECC